jgi:holo-[acyl-carrier protein] synthase
MIKGIGTDIVQINRFQLWIENPKLIERFFHPLEIHELDSKSGEGYQGTLAGRFAAKEAFGKALGTGLRNIRLSDIRVSRDTLGKPFFILEGSALEKSQAFGVTSLHLSISHDGNFALAFVVLEGGDN